MDDRPLGLKYIGLDMFTQPQIQYIEEVLGVPTHHFAVSEAAVEAEEPPIEVLVVTAKLSLEERALLEKILGAIQLKDYSHVEADFATDWREGLTPASHIFIFQNKDEADRDDDGMNVTWTFPSVAGMTGTSVEVAARKKATWAQLQRFAKERE